MLNKIFNKSRSLCLFLFLIIEFIFSGLRIIFFTNQEIVDFEIACDPNRDTITETEQKLSLINQLEQTAYPGASEIFIIGKDEEDFE